jgi:uncharacterized protein
VTSSLIRPGGLAAAGRRGRLQLDPTQNGAAEVTESPSVRTEANRRTIRAAFDAWREGTGAITDVFAPDRVWRIEGHSLASKKYNDKQQFIDEVLTPFGARFRP